MFKCICILYVYVWWYVYGYVYWYEYAFTYTSICTIVSIYIYIEKHIMYLFSLYIYIYSYLYINLRDHLGHVLFFAFWGLEDQSFPLSLGQRPSSSRSPGRNKHIAKHCSNASSLITGSPASIASTIEADWSVVCKRALSEPLSCRFKPLPARWCLFG